MPDFGRTLLIISTYLAITACGIRGAEHSADPINPTSSNDHKHDYWICEANETGDGWDCVQGPRLAKRPGPTRHPEQPQPKPDSMATMSSPDASDLPMTPDPGQVPTDLTNDDLADDGVRTEAPASQSIPAPILKPKSLSSEPHDWQQFGYRQATSITLSELPAHFYTVQIVAMSSMEALQAFAKEHLLSDALAARTEANGKFYYVLLLGIYETLADAKAAAAVRPESLANIDPWFRKLGSLQAAVQRADDSTTSLVHLHGS
jgi:septal ring-binding cell division protein DamX